MVLSETKRKLKDRYVVESTTNYDMFKHLNGNREETQRRKSLISSSVNDVGQIPTPVIINEKNEVIDGQGRLEAFKELGLPIYYMKVAGLGLPECVAMNRTSTNWRLSDYINSYASLGDKNYQVLKQFIKKYEKLPIDVITWALCGATTTVKRLQKGTFEVDLECLRNADETLSDILDITKGLERKGNWFQFQAAIGWCLRNSRIDNETLKRKVRMNSHMFESYHTVSDWMKAIDAVYNYKTRTEKQVPIRALWEMDWRERKAGRQK